MATDPRFKAAAAALATQAANPRVQIPVSRKVVEPDKLTGTAVGEMLDQLASFHADFAGFVMWAFPWGEPGTMLEGMTGPEDWQREQQQRIGAAILAGGEEGCVIEEDVSSGHGVGKSAEVSWAILWGISTSPDTRGVVTANTDTQLRTKTWAELGKWYQLFIAKQLFTLTATSIYIADDPDRQKTWRIDQIPWSREKSEAFAGLHNHGKRLLVIFDEASAIDDLIWEVTEGALTDAKTQILWLRYGNPTKTSGKFFKNCTQGRRNTYTRVDSRTISFSNKAQLNAWVEEYGEDSDFVRVRVKGMFPRAGYANFISPELVQQARRRRINPSEVQAHPKILAVDPARFGDDSSVITLRQSIRVYYQIELKGFDGPDLAARIFELIRSHGVVQGSGIPPGPIACIVYDAIGNGADLDSSLRRMQGLPQLLPIQWGVPANDDQQYFNLRSECWGKMRSWLEHGQIPDDDDLGEQLISLDYGHDGRNRIQLQSKKDAKKAGVRSPDKADSLALSMVPDLIKISTRAAKVRPVARRQIIWTR